MAEPARNATIGNGIAPARGHLREPQPNMVSQLDFSERDCAESQLQPGGYHVARE